MSTPFDLLKADYLDKRGELKYVDVDLSSGTLRIFYSPVMNAKQKAEIFNHMSSLEVFVTSLLVRGLNEDGTRMFKDAQRQELLTQVDSDVLEKIAIEMGSLEEDVDPKV